jgi:hypothetical protein
MSLFHVLFAPLAPWWAIGLAGALAIVLLFLGGGRPAGLRLAIDPGRGHSSCFEQSPLERGGGVASG